MYRGTSDARPKNLIAVRILVWTSDGFFIMRIEFRAAKPLRLMNFCRSASTTYESIEPTGAQVPRTRLRPRGSRVKINMNQRRHGPGSALRTQSVVGVIVVAVILAGTARAPHSLSTGSGFGGPCRILGRLAAAIVRETEYDNYHDA